MKPYVRLILAGACLAAIAGAAQAQPYGRGGRATLYEFPNFQGRSITIDGSNSNLGDTGFNDMAQSGHFDGDWTVCADSDFRGRCQTVSGDAPDLNRLGMGRSISSLQRGAVNTYGDNDRDRDHGDDRGGNDDHRGYGDDQRGPGWNGPPAGPVGGQWGAGAWGGGGTPGRSVVFFPRPQNHGQDIAAYDRGAADWFCQRQGLGAAVYYDTSSRGSAFRWNGGAIALNAPVLRDVVCRKY